MNISNQELLILEHHKLRLYLAIGGFNFIKDCIDLFSKG